MQLVDCTALILAGGNGSRLGRVGSFIPKSLLPVSGDDTLLSRLLFQLIRAGITSIVVSTSPRLSAYIAEAVELIKEQPHYPNEVRCTVLSNSSHLSGPVPALAEAISRANSAYYFLYLGDIFMEALPIIGSIAAACHNSMLFGSTPAAGDDGFLEVCSRHNTVSRCWKTAEPIEVGAGTKSWSGMALIRADAALELANWGESRSQVALETAFEHLISSGFQFSFMECGPFKNVNTIEQWLEVMNPTKKLHRELPFQI